MHRQEAIEEREDGEVGVRALEPKGIRAVGADHRGVLVLDIGFAGVAHPDEEAGELLVGAALREHPGDFVVDIPPGNVQTVDLFPVRDGEFVDDGGDHMDLTMVGPGGKYILFCHKTHSI